MKNCSKRQILTEEGVGIGSDTVVHNKGLYIHQKRLHSLCWSLCIFSYHHIVKIVCFELLLQNMPFYHFINICMCSCLVVRHALSNKSCHNYYLQKAWYRSI